MKNIELKFEHMVRIEKKERIDPFSDAKKGLFPMTIPPLQNISGCILYIYLDHPLNIRHAFIQNVTNTSITIDWEDDSYNRNANITHYELVLK